MQLVVGLLLVLWRHLHWFSLHRFAVSQVRTQLLVPGYACQWRAVMWLSDLVKTSRKGV